MLANNYKFTITLPSVAVAVAILAGQLTCDSQVAGSSLGWLDTIV